MQRIWFRKSESAWYLTVQENGKQKQLRLLRDGNTKEDRRKAEEMAIQELANRNIEPQVPKIQSWFPSITLQMPTMCPTAPSPSAPLTRAADEVHPGITRLEMPTLGTSAPMSSAPSSREPDLTRTLPYSAGGRRWRSVPVNAPSYSF